MSMSLDGFVSAADGGIKWIFQNDPDAIAWTLETVWNASLHIMGSRTFRDMVAFWPPMNQIPKAVFSKRGAAILDSATSASTTAALTDARAQPGDGTAGAPQPGSDSWAKSTVATGELAEEIARLKAQDGKPIIAHGGAGFARGLIASGLVDRYALLVHPVILGQGLPIFTDLAAPRPLSLVSARAFPKGAIAQIYRPA
jgi:dihydrofolate reductase